MSTPSPSRPARHSRDDIVAAALTLLDAHGLPDLTMRRLAAELDVRPSALYWHFDSKQQLLAAVSDRILAADPAEADLASSVAWSEAVRHRAVALRAALLAHRDGAEVVSSTLALGLGTGRPVSGLRTLFAHAGLASDQARAAAEAIVHFVLGAVWHEQQRALAQAFGIPVPEAKRANGADVRRSGGRAGEAGAGMGALPADFAFGLDAIIAGIAVIADGGGRDA